MRDSSMSARCDRPSAPRRRRRIVEKEFALAGSEQNPDLTGRSWREPLKRVRSGDPHPVQAFLDHGADFVVAASLPELVAGMA
jgi:predicted oxidoreductase